MSNRKAKRLTMRRRMANPTSEQVGQIVTAWAFAHDIDGAARNDLMKRLASVPATDKAVDQDCNYCGGVGKFQVVSPRSDHAWAPCFCTLTTPSQGAQDERVETMIASGVHEAVSEEQGFWTSCSGCHQTCDGQETGDYPYSKVFRCYVGMGCGECGGIGVVWDDTDYEDFAKFCQNNDETCNDDGTTLSATDAPSNELREAALEEAARVAEQSGGWGQDNIPLNHRDSAQRIAKAIRALSNTGEVDNG